MKGKSLSRVRLLATPWTAAYQAPPSMGFSRQEYWSGVPLPSPKQTLIDIKGEIDSDTIIVGDFNPPLTPTDRLSKQKINKETQVLNDTLDEMDLIDILRTSHPNAEEYTFFSSAHGTFSRIDHILDHKSNLSKFKKIEIVSNIFSDHREHGSNLDVHQQMNG